jgi:hypothetical protein
MGQQAAKHHVICEVIPEECARDVMTDFCLSEIIISYKVNVAVNLSVRAGDDSSAPRIYSPYAPYKLPSS